MAAPHPSERPGWEPPNKGKKYPPEVLTPDEVRALLATRPPTTRTGLRDRALITVLYRTGLRISEALALLPKDIDPAVGSIAVLHGKGDRHRVVGIDAIALDIVGRWLDRRAELGHPPTDAVFCTSTGRPMDDGYFRALLPRLARRAGITKRVHAHGLRHTHAFELMMEGVPMRIIQQQLGHVSLATTDRYLAHIAPREVIEAMRDRTWQP